MSDTKYNTTSLIYLIWFSLTVLVVSAFAPTIFSVIDVHLSALAYLPFQHLCHQQADRSFILAGLPLAVCARCLGIFAGLWLGAVPYTFQFQRLTLQNHPFPAGLICIAAISLNIVQWFLGYAQIITISNNIRFSLGLIAGVSLLFYIRSHSKMNKTNT